jgi:HK97 gp10 family phage protein
MRTTFHTTVVYNNYVIASEVKAQLIEAGLRKIMFEVRSKAKELVRKDTTTLMKSISFRKVEIGIYELYTNVEYAVYQEFGTNKMTAKPFMFPATYEGGARVQAMCAAVLAQGM